MLDICAGAGGKTLAMAAAMRNTGQIYAYDDDPVRLRPIFERLKRAGVRNAQVLNAGDQAALAALGPRFDLVLIDASCTGTGSWRRRPDAKWRLKPANLAQRQAEQRAVLALGAPLVKPGGRLVYVTCSVLPEENGEQVAGLSREPSGVCDVTVARRVAGGARRRSADIGRRQRGRPFCSPRRVTTPTASSSPCMTRQTDMSCGGPTPDARQLAQRRHRPQINV